MTAIHPNPRRTLPSTSPSYSKTTTDAPTIYCEATQLPLLRPSRDGAAALTEPDGTTSATSSTTALKRADMILRPPTERKMATRPPIAGSVPGRADEVERLVKAIAERARKIVE